MDTIKTVLNIMLIIIVTLLFLTANYIKTNNEVLTAKVIESLDNQNISFEIKQIKQNFAFESPNISYSISENCSLNLTSRFLEALKIIETNTTIRFSNTRANPEIQIVCLNSEINREEDLMKISEGGPILSYNNTILESKIILYEINNLKCEFPVIELHELLHAFGFDHTRDPKSVMYPIFTCKKALDKDIIELLNKIYN